MGRLHKWWQKSGTVWRVIAIVDVIIGILFVVGVVSQLGMDTGFGSFSAPDGTYYREKTLWDWLELAIVPAVLISLVALLNYGAGERERRTTIEREQEEALRLYLDNMSEFFLKYDLREKLKKVTVEAGAYYDTRGGDDPPVVDIARVRTVTTLRKLNVRRREEVIDFLRDAGLYFGESALLQRAIMPRIDLRGSNFWNVNLAWAKLSEASLTAVDFTLANLQGAHMTGANLSSARLSSTNLSEAILRAVDLSQANLVNANLTEARLGGSDLSGAKLKNADLSGAQLNFAYIGGADLTGANLSGANLLGTLINQSTILPDGSKWSPNMKVQGLQERWGTKMIELKLARTKQEAQVIQEQNGISFE